MLAIWLRNGFDIGLLRNWYLPLPGADPTAANPGLTVTNHVSKSAPPGIEQKTNLRCESAKQIKSLHFTKTFQ
ncbi:hypothetical protein PBAL39_19165 [Pedobacter sp. BAL39]|nr:hypothetical protein PBAL39_19165 [Pedobacter sp. BAL39]